MSTKLRKKIIFIKYIHVYVLIGHFIENNKIKLSKAALRSVSIPNSPNETISSQLIILLSSNAPVLFYDQLISNDFLICFLVLKLHTKQLCTV